MLLGSLIVSLLFGSRTLAQAELEPQPSADELFHDGLRQYAAGEFPAACGNFEASYKLVPRPGTLYNLGVCHKELGQYLRARRELMQVRALAERDGQQQRAASAETHIRALEAELGWIQVAPIAELVAVTQHLHLDGSEVVLQANQPIAVMPGEHTLRLEATGYQAREIDVEVAREMHVRVVFPPLDKQLPPVVAAPAAALEQKREPLSGSSSPSSTLRAVSLVVGIVGVAASLGLGAWALERKAALQDCDMDIGCRPSRHSIASTGQTVATVSTVLGGVGALGFGAWVFLPGGWFNQSGGREAAPDTRAGLTVRGVF